MIKALKLSARFVDLALYDSNRPGHLAAAVGVGASVIAAGAVISLPWLMGVGATTTLWEWLATPDVDVAEKRRPRGLWRIICAFWLPYALLTPHRSRWSHSLAFGLPARLAYVFGWVVLVAWAVGNLAVLRWLVGDAWYIGQGRLSEAAALLWQRWGMLLCGAAIGDTLHMIKDKYTPDEILWGK